MDSSNFMKPTLFCACIILCLSHAALAQKVTDVNKHIDKLRVYEKVVKDGYGTSAIYTELANGYYFKSDYKKAKKWFETLFEVDEASFTDEQLQWRYQQTLKVLKLKTRKRDQSQPELKQQGYSLQANDHGGH